MSNSIKSYMELCEMLGQEPEVAEYIAWAYLGIVPKWYEEALNE